MKNKKILIAFTALFLVIIYFTGTNLYKNYKKETLGFLAKENIELFIRDYSPSLGPENAPVYLVEFLDPECGTCREFYPFVKQLMSEYPGKIKLIVRYAPFHKNSKFVVKILEAARMQGKYWETLELLFQYQPKWGDHHNPQPHLVWSFLPEINLDIDKIKKDMNDPKIAAIIEQDIKDSKKLDVKLTPTFFVNGNPLKSFGYQQLREAIEDEIKRSIK